jgi:hypothetical protein
MKADASAGVNHWLGSTTANTSRQPQQPRRPTAAQRRAATRCLRDTACTAGTTRTRDDAGGPTIGRRSLTSTQ